MKNEVVVKGIMVNYKKVNQEDFVCLMVIVKANYRIHSDAIKENIVPTLTERQISFVYINEFYLLNVALLGKTAVEWKNKSPTLKGDIRDYSAIEQPFVIANMKCYNAILIEQIATQVKQLNNMAK